MLNSAIIYILKGKLIKGKLIKGNLMESRQKKFV